MRPWIGSLRAITFDFGNTLVPVGRADLRRAVEATADALMAGAPAGERDRFLAMWAEERDRQFAEEVPNFREVDMRQRLVRVFARLRGMAVPPPDRRWDDAAAAAYSEPEEVTLGLESYTRGFVRAIPPPPGVEPMLEALAARFRLAILSNWPLAATIDRYVEEAGWGRHLEAIVVSERVGTIKPQPAMFRAAEAALGLPAPETILHVGDDWAADVVGAKRAGWHSAYLLDRPEGSPLPGSVRDDTGAADLELERLADLLPLVLGPG